MNMGTIALVGVFIILGAIFWTKKSRWQTQNPIGFVALLVIIVLLGVMLGPNLNDYLVPDFLEKWSYVDAYQNGPGGSNHVLFLFTMIIIGFALVILAKAVRPLMRFRIIAPTLLVLSGLAYFYFGSSIGMNLKAINVDVTQTAGQQMTPVGQQMMVSGLNTFGTFANQVSSGLQSTKTIAPKYIIQEAQKKQPANESEGTFSSWQPWAMKNQESQSQVSNEYHAISNDVDVANRSSALQESEGEGEDYNPADFAPAVEQRDESTADFWQEVQPPTTEEKKPEMKKDKRPPPLRYSGKKKSGPTP